jgi:D-alanyl-D-alanine carboxypeptidase
MTLGWHIGAGGGARFFYREGGGGGFRAMTRLNPERGFGSVAIANATGFDAGACLEAMDRGFVV